MNNSYGTDVLFDPENPDKTTITISISSNTRGVFTHHLSGLIGNHLKELGFKNINFRTMIKENDNNDFSDPMYAPAPFIKNALNKTNVVFDLTNFYKPLNENING